MRLSDYDYFLPDELIAQVPIEPRDASRLMVLERQHESISHHFFRDIEQLLNPGDVLVLNKTKVLPARLIGQKENTGARIEILLLNRLAAARWEVLVKPGKRLKLNQKVVFGAGILTGVLADILDNGNRIIEFEFNGLFEEVLDKLGQMPLPPYITTELENKERYQTVYAKESGSAAAPTAGLHFTDELLGRIRQRGVDVEEILLHVGLGTFRPVKTENITEHEMHCEFYRIDPETASRLNQAKKSGRRIIAVGTTVVRTLESAARNAEPESGVVFKELDGWTDIFIYPRYQFKVVDALITNFHFPKSTLIMLVSALAGREFILRAYEEAVNERYRFFSFGDCMFIY